MHKRCQCVARSAWSDAARFGQRTGGSERRNQWNVKFCKVSSVVVVQLCHLHLLHHPTPRPFLVPACYSKHYLTVSLIRHCCSGGKADGGAAVGKHSLPEGGVIRPPFFTTPSFDKRVQGRTPLRVEFRVLLLALGYGVALARSDARTRPSSSCARTEAVAIVATPTSSHPQRLTFGTWRNRHASCCCCWLLLLQARLSARCASSPPTRAVLH
jgi:hypothetical protein